MEETATKKNIEQVLKVLIFALNYTFQGSFESIC